MSQRAINRRRAVEHKQLRSEAARPAIATITSTSPLKATIEGSAAVAVVATGATPSIGDQVLALRWGGRIHVVTGGSGGGGGITEESDPIASAALTTHAADTTSVHGITDTSALVVDSDLGTAAAADTIDFDAAGAAAAVASDLATLETDTTTALAGKQRLDSTLFYPEDYGAARDGTTDDTEALQDCIDAAMAVNGTVRLSAGVYLVDSAPRTDRSGNCILSIFDAENSEKGLSIEGATPTSGVNNSAYLDLPLSSSYSIIKTTRTSDDYSATYGAPSVIGGGTPEVLGASFQNYCGPVTLENFLVQLPLDPAICGVDAASFGGVVRKDFQVVCGATGGDATAVATNVYQFGFRHNARWVGSRNHHIRSTVFQGYFGEIFFDTDHARFDSSGGFRCRCALGFDGSTGSDGGYYPIVDSYFMAQGCPTTIAGYSPTSGVVDVPYEVFFTDLAVQVEGATAPFAVSEFCKDASNRLKGRIKVHFFNGLGVSDDPPTMNGGANLDVIGPRGKYAHEEGASLTDVQALEMGDAVPIETYGDGLFDAIYSHFFAAGDAQAAFGWTRSFMFWGAGGASAPDVVLQRAAANRLEVSSGDTIGWASGAAGTVWSAAGAMAGLSFNGGVVQNQGYLIRVLVLHRCTITGITVPNGATVGGNLKVALFDNSSTLSRLALSNATAQGSAGTAQQIPFTSSYDAHPGLYYLWVASDSSTATLVMARTSQYGSTTATEYASPPSTKTRPSSPATPFMPLLATY